MRPIFGPLATTAAIAAALPAAAQTDVRLVASHPRNDAEVTAPGKYYVHYGASVTAGKTISAVAGSITFTVTDPNAPADDGATGTSD
ncbi:MAG: hypothetical protein U0S50_08720 [Sphingopyxis sp.]|uniref:hypothetical protein n=1 Tax=Sphingopyxis sp. TaxID=1908224 RepID=UPI002AB90191|nr:hypothetical protein [Sphingopyxis sp.]MDZ3831885.1 hypothetical protein [Sphingopyxis sp.]